MAAYGHPALPRPAATANRQETGQTPNPFQVDLPLLWTMAVTDHLPIQYELNCQRRLGFIGSIAARRTMEPAGQQSHICSAFSQADKETQENLLKDNDTYKDHFYTLKRGESV